MNQESIVHKLKDAFHLLREKIHHDEKTTPIDDELNAYDKMKIETLINKEINSKIRHDDAFKPPGAQEKTNNRDISAI